MAKLIKKIFTTNTTFVVPAGVSTMTVIGVGAGGSSSGASSGYKTFDFTTAYPTGGYAGGSAQPSTVLIGVVPGQTLTIEIGQPGTAGVGGAQPSTSGVINSGTDGSDGGDSYIANSFTKLAIFKGAGGGKAATFMNNSGNFITVPGRGGAPINTLGITNPTASALPGSGGMANNYLNYVSSAQSDGYDGFTGVPAGIGGSLGTGTISGNLSFAGGGGSGSGGGGIVQFGNIYTLIGLAGSAGGNVVSNSVGGNGQDGLSPSSLNFTVYGLGGSGPGAGGCGDGGQLGGKGGNGAQGSAGAIILTYIQ